MRDKTDGGQSVRQEPRQSTVPGAPMAGSASLPPPALLNVRQAAALLGVSERRFHEMRSLPWMPSAVELGPRALRWSGAELLAAVAEHAPRQRTQSEPAQLARERIERLKAAR